MWLRLALATSLIYLVPAVVCAQYVFHSLEEVWMYTEQHNFEISVSKKQLAMAVAGVQQAKGKFLPSATITGSYTDNVVIQPTLVPAELFGGPPGTYVEEKFGKRYNYNAGFNAHVDLINVSNWYTLRGASRQVAASELNEKLTRQEVYRTTAHAFFQCRWAMESEALAGEAAHTAHQIALHTQRQFAQGLASELSLNNSRIYQKNAALAELTAQQYTSSSLDQLKALLNLSSEDSVSLPFDSLSLPDVDTTSLSAFIPLNVRHSHLQMLNARNTWQGAKASFAPTLSAIYSYQTQWTGSEFLDFSSSSKLPQQFWGLRLSIPVLANQTRLFQIQKARIEWETAQLQYERALKQAAITDNDLQHQFDWAYQTLRQSKEIFDLYRKNDLHADRLLQAGQTSLDERLRVYQDYINYKNEYLKNLSQFYMRYADLLVRQRNF